MEDHLPPKEKELLWKKFLAGDTAAAEQICLLYMQPLALYCFYFVKDEATASDIATDSLLKIKSYALQKKIDYPEGLLYTTAKNKCLTKLRNVSNRRNILDALLPFFSFSHVPEAEKNMAQEDIDKFLQDVWYTNENLTDTDFQIWKLHQEGYRNPEIAETLALDIALVERRKHYVRNILKEAINKKRKNKGSSSHLWIILAAFCKVIYFGLNGLRNYVCPSTST